MSNKKKLAVIIMAAGKGTRMKNPDIAKVMYEVAGQPMIAHVVDLSNKLQPSRILVIVGWQRNSVVDYFMATENNIEFVDQLQQLGTGHAIMQTESYLANFEGDVLILSGDVPLLTKQTLDGLLKHHNESFASATIVSAEISNPTGYGRIIRSKDGSVIKIVEQKDATANELAVQEINSGIYLFDKVKLFDALKHLKPTNAQGEYYLTDVFENFWKNGWKVSALKTPDSIEIMGINDLNQLEEARKLFDSRKTIQRS
ncbi:MAG: sugar phosphate nucleotidyltransferase [Bacteroidota bacterium]|nr:sugar phosphate nucleotidyltransferase [Bacteroidota bacterium]